VRERRPTSIRRHIFVCFPGAWLRLSVHVCAYVCMCGEERREQRGFFLRSVRFIEEIGFLNTITAMRQYRRGSSSYLEGCGTRFRGFLFCFFFCGSSVRGVGEWTNCEEWKILCVCFTRV
jgi:hypothetical protein